MPVDRPINVNYISRSTEAHTRSRSGDPYVQFHNPAAAHHPHAAAREYVRALNAVKFQKMFAKPFLAAFDAHADSVYALSTVPQSLTHIISADGSGEIKMFHLSTRRCTFTRKAHNGIIKAVATQHNGEHVVSCGHDQKIMLWRLQQQRSLPADDDDADEHDGAIGEPFDGGLTLKAVNTYSGSSSFQCITHHYNDDLFASGSGDRVDLWSANRSTPLHSFSWSTDNINAVRFSPSEHDLLLSAAADRSIILYDTRLRTPVRKVVMLMQTNEICWNPQAPYVFSTANDDHNAYSFDTRKLDHAMMIHADHLGAVMSVDYAPTGTELVTGSYDRTIRIFPTDSSGGHSREVYHGRRMQRVFSVRYSLDSHYILSGSDDTNVRLWKANASQKIGTMTHRERNAINYRNTLIERYEHVPELRRIHRHRHIPKAILSGKNLKAIMTTSATTKEKRRREHSNMAAPVSAKKRSIRKEVE